MQACATFEASAMLPNAHGPPRSSPHTSISKPAAFFNEMPPPPAAQPDIVRASQKDASYSFQVSELVQDAVRRILGPRRAILCSSETDLVSGILYYALTTGCGSQTLGEEYCDILQTTGLPGREPGLLRRATLVLLDTLGPYLAEKLQHHYGSAEQPFWSSERALRENVLSASATLLPWSLRLHLALFYLFGTYYAWPKRLTGTRYTFLGKLFEQRPSYRILGILMFIQLATNAAFWGLSNSVVPELQDRMGGSEGKTGRLKQDHVATVLEEAPRIQQARPQQEESAHRCPLCLSPRNCPTSTPCGHVFCWECIAAWANQKPECPLCRSPVVGSDLVPVQHTDF